MSNKRNKANNKSRDKNKLAKNIKVALSQPLEVKAEAVTEAVVEVNTCAQNQQHEMENTTMSKEIVRLTAAQAGARALQSPIAFCTNDIMKNVELLRKFEKEAYDSGNVQGFCSDKLATFYHIVDNDNKASMPNVDVYIQFAELKYKAQVGAVDHKVFYDFNAKAKELENKTPGTTTVGNGEIMNNDANNHSGKLPSTSILSGRATSSLVAGLTGTVVSLASDLICRDDKSFTEMAVTATVAGVTSASLGYVAASVADLNENTPTLNVVMGVSAGLIAGGMADKAYERILSACQSEFSDIPADNIEVPDLMAD